MALGALAIGCAKQEKTRATPSSAATAVTASTPTPEVDPTPHSRLLEWDIDGPFGADRAAILVPSDASQKYPVLVALHGRGEAVKSPQAGALGWPRDYAMRRAIERVYAPPLVDADFEGFSDAARMAKMNADLAAKPYGGLIVACPHIPDVPPNGDVRAIARFVIDTLLPRVRRETPAIDSPDATGIDGVSMGGALALRIGLTNPNAFGAVGSLQAAIAEEHTQELTELARAARAKKPPLKLRLVTSHDDYFRDAIKHLSESWRAANVAHDFADVPGPHDYAFNRGPGSIELLTFYDRALR
jgi:enterochelin esterase-like enzyme